MGSTRGDSELQARISPVKALILGPHDDCGCQGAYIRKKEKIQIGSAHAARIRQDS